LEEYRSLLSYCFEYGIVSVGTTDQGKGRGEGIGDLCCEAIMTPCTEIRLHVPDIRRSSLHTTAEGFYQDGEDTNVSQEVRLALLKTYSVYRKGV
jgi:hypothetical protein